MARSQFNPQLCRGLYLLLCWLAALTSLKATPCCLSRRLSEPIIEGHGARGPLLSVVPRNGLPPSALRIQGLRHLDGWVQGFGIRDNMPQCFRKPCFLTLDLVKIFGRLSGSSAVGSALVSPYESPAAAAKAILEAEETTRGGEAKLWSVKEWLELQQPSLLLRRPLRAGTKKSERQLQSWEQLFSRPRGFEKEAPHQLYAKNPGLLFEEFCERTQGLNFEWPCTMNTGQAPLNIRVVPVANEEFLRTCRRMRRASRKETQDPPKFSWREINEFVGKDPISNDALECVFRSLLAGAGSTAPHIHREDILRCIWKWAPADGVVEWEQFLFFVEEAPQNGLQGAVD